MAVHPSKVIPDYWCLPVRTRARYERKHRATVHAETLAGEGLVESEHSDPESVAWCVSEAWYAERVTEAGECGECGGDIVWAAPEIAEAA